MTFASVPIRSNAQQVVASWWNALRTAGVTLEQGVNPESNRNFILNSQFRFWQESLNKVITSSGSVENQYGADQVLISNSFASGGEVRAERIAGVNTRFAFQMKVETFVSTAGDYDAYFPIANRETNQLLNKTVMFRCLIKAVGNVNRVGITYRSNTSESFSGLNDIGIGESNTPINNSTFTEVFFSQPIATEPTQAGMLWLRLRPNQASSGDENDAGNGIIVEQPQLVIGTVIPASFFPAYKDEAIELAALQYFYEKSYDVDILPGVSAGSPILRVRGDGTATVSASFKKTKRAPPTLLIFAPGGSAEGLYLDVGAANNQGLAGRSASESILNIITTSGLNATISFHFVSDARIF